MKSIKMLLTLVLSLSIFNMQIAQANFQLNSAGEELVSTMELVNASERAEVESRIKTMAGDDEIQGQLAEMGLTPSEIDLRLSHLSYGELTQLEQSMQQAEAGGILVTILIVVLIIYLAQRI